VSAKNKETSSDVSAKTVKQSEHQKETENEP
jgi:hypothetical protein